MIGKMRAGYHQFWDANEWLSRAHRFWFRFCAVCLSIYISYVVYFSKSTCLMSGAATIASLVCFVGMAVAVYALMLWACKRLGSKRLLSKPMQKENAWKLFCICTALSLIILGSLFLASYPGAVSYDISNQWRQWASGEFNNWHPVFHTLLVGLVASVYHNYSFVLLVQIIAFSLAMGYLITTLCQKGVPIWLALVVQLLVVNSETVKNVLMYLGKDGAMSIGVLLLTAYTMKLLFSQGEWITKTRNAILFGLMLAFVTLVRHNGMMYTISLLLFAGFSYLKYRKQMVVSAAVFILCMVLVQGPLYGALDVVYPKNTVEESVGIPMIIMGNAKQQSPESLDEETDAFLATLATDEQWNTVYRRNNYNVIKFTFDHELVANTPIDQILRMTLSTAASNPRLTFETINAVTGLVWNIDGEGRAIEAVRNSGDIPEVVRASGKRNALGNAICSVLDAPMKLPPLRYLLDNFGVQLMILLLCTMLALYRCGTAVLMLAVPTLLYMLGTMLLLCGEDARFFHFVPCIAYPTVCVLLYLPRGEKLETGV